MSLLAWVLAADLVARAVRQRSDATAEADRMVRRADQYLAYVRRHGSPEQVQAAQQTADAWRGYRDSL